MTSLELNRDSYCDSDLVSELEKMFESKIGVVMGELLADDMEGCGEELVLKRACAPGGGKPYEVLEFIRSVNGGTSAAASIRTQASNDRFCPLRI